MNRDEAIAILVRVEDVLFEERARLIVEAQALEVARSVSCAAAVALTGLLPAFILGLRRLCDIADVAELATRRDTVLTAIASIEGAVERLPRVADLLDGDPARAVRAVESMMAVAEAAADISGIGDLLDDTVELLRGLADDTRTIVGGGLGEALKGVGVVLIGGGILWWMSQRRGRG